MTCLVFGSIRCDDLMVVSVCLIFLLVERSKLGVFYGVRVPLWHTTAGKSVSRMKSLLFFIAGGSVVFSGEEGTYAKRPNRNPGSSTRPGGSLSKTLVAPIIRGANRNNHIMSIRKFLAGAGTRSVRDLRFYLFPPPFQYRRKYKLTKFTVFPLS